jgi:hypothetical protein
VAKQTPRIGALHQQQSGGTLGRHVAIHSAQGAIRIEDLKRLLPNFGVLTDPIANIVRDQGHGLTDTGVILFYADRGHFPCGLVGGNAEQQAAGEYGNHEF